MPNLEVSENGLGILHAESDRIRLLDGPTSLLDADGSALIIHGGQIACQSVIGEGTDILVRLPRVT